jgi:hypothetical protein
LAFTEKAEGVSVPILRITTDVVLLANKFGTAPANKSLLNCLAPGTGTDSALGLMPPEIDASDQGESVRKGYDPTFPF